MDITTDIAETINNFNFIPRVSEDNYFSIGTKGFYENPFTEVIAYILDSSSKYRYRSEFLKLLLENAVDVDVIESLVEFCKVNIQHSTTEGNFIDLILVNNNYILVFENKIFHGLANPFGDYVNDINRRYPSLKKIFVVLSYIPVQPPLPWINIIIKHTFENIKHKLVPTFENKWDYFVNDFIHHFSNHNHQIMTKEEETFFQNNFAKVIAASNGLNEFILSIGERVQSSTHALRFEYATNWGKISRALRFYPLKTKDNVTLIFNEDGKFSIGIYYYQDHKKHLHSIHKFIGNDNYESWKEGAACCYGRLIGKYYTSLENAIDECKLQLEKMKKYYE